MTCDAASPSNRYEISAIPPGCKIEAVAVAHYFIDTYDDDVYVHDDEGYLLPGPEEARKIALSALLDMAQDKIADSDNRTFRAYVHDERRTLIYTAFLVLDAEWKAYISMSKNDFSYSINNPS